ncbi:MAG TPA: hypothetical protein VF653_01295 [Methylomirabilota bacterium]
MSRRNANAVVIACMLALFAALGAFQVYAAHQESKTYNRLTGANTTTWDALWVELRVQGEID